MVLKKVALNFTNIDSVYEIWQIYKIKNHIDGALKILGWIKWKGTVGLKWKGIIF